MSRPRSEDPDRVHTMLRIPRGLHERLAAEAAAREVSVNWLACRLLAESMERLIPVDEIVLTRPPERVPRA